jgi:hypothetical protein
MLEQAERAAERQSAAQRSRTRELVLAAELRAAAARDFRYARQAPAALALYREALALLTTALLVAGGEIGVGEPLGPPAAWPKLVGMLGDRLPPLPASLAQLEPLLGSEQLLAADRAQPSELRAALAAADILVDWARTGLEIRSVREIRRQRMVRLAAAGLGLVVLLTAAVAAAVAPRNVALGKPARASSQRPGTPPAAGAVDGEHSGTFGLHTNRDDPPWLEIDLLEPYAISKVLVYNRGDGHFDDALPLGLSLSDDGRQWRQVAVRTKRFTAARPWRVSLDGQIARFVRLSPNRRGFLVLSEVEVFGKKP